VVEELADRYSGCAGGVGFYHAGLTSNERKTTQTRFSEGAIKILFATTAFGMGVDYADIRAVIHYNIPASIESYYQEIGRAGRDGKMSTALLLYAKRDKGLQAYFIRRTNGRFVDPKITAAKWRGLEKLAALLESQTCRHIGILSHFSDRSIAIECGHCDVCDPSSEHMIRVNEKKLAKLRRGVQRWATSTRE
jgi:ATP-dependent DNA helicase RecQ